MLMRVHARFDPVTVYLLCLAMYSMVMFVHRLQVHRQEQFQDQLSQQLETSVDQLPKTAALKLQQSRSKR